ncbi:hypothetical protein BKA64DRAFT_773256 [Cadophora sp. MPI-SDFR-AT-0126]|nr:hypothetical protein BKA64DRAFT_773256 [Leotiomycetes sp. MPI-SDFR-AT-0126]
MPQVPVAYLHGENAALELYYLVSTLDDYSAFLLTILDEGSHPNTGTRILQAETVRKYLFEDQVAHLGPSQKTTARKGAQVGVIGSANPSLASDGELLPGLRKGWSCGLMVALERVPGGRTEGCGSWGGLGNSYYWVDPKAGKLGLIMTCLWPFMDKEVLELYDQLEKAVYEK